MIPQNRFPRLRELCGGEITLAKTKPIAARIREYSAETQAEWEDFKKWFDENPGFMLRAIVGACEADLRRSRQKSRRRAK